MKKRIEELIEQNKRNGPPPVPVRCCICSLPVEKRRAVDKSLMEKNTSLEAIATDLGIAKSSVFRHAKNHLIPQVRERLLAAVASRPGVLENAETAEDFRDLNARADLIPLFRKGEGLLKISETNEDLQAARGFLSELRQVLELSARLDGKLGDGPSREKPSPQVVIVINAVSGASALQASATDDLRINAPVTIDSRAERA